MAKKQQWHQFSTEFGAKLYKLIKGRFEVMDLKYEIIVGKIFVAEFECKKVGTVLPVNVRLGKEVSVEALETRLLKFFKK